MDQVVLLIRNPRWAIPSYHTMRYELDYARDIPSSLLRIPDTYTERPAVNKWETWRDGRLNIEMNRWSTFIDFWLQGGFQERTNATHDRCLYSEIDCHPKAIIDFDHFYQKHPTNEYEKLTDVLESSANVEVVAAKARVCVLNKVYNRSELHQGNRPHPERPPEYRFTVPQFDRIMNRTIELVNKFSEEPLSFEPTAPDLVRILNSYALDNLFEYHSEVAQFVDEWILDFFGTNDCYSITDSLTSTICEFMKVWRNHDIFTDGYYPDNFPYEKWLEVSKQDIPHTLENVILSLHTTDFSCLFYHRNELLYWKCITRLP